MRSDNWIARSIVTAQLVVVAMFLLQGASGQQSAAAESREQLVDVLLRKGILTPAEAHSAHQAPTAEQTDHRLAQILLAKGVLSRAEFDRLAGHPLEPLASGAKAAPALAAVAQKTEPQTQQPIQSAASALAPIRLLPVGAVPRDTAPAIKANGVGITPYGFIKATVVEDSSSPCGDDFPLPGFLCDAGPDGAPEFHVKARSSRFGARFSWSGPSSKWNLTGKVEMDFEGNFNRSDNRSLSSVRSSNPSLRLAWGRLDYSVNGANTLSLLFGQDWTPFGSSTVPNVLETTGMGIGFGVLYERSPQMRAGYTHNTAGVQLMAEIAAALPASGLTPSSSYLGQQLGYGERQGPDSNRPNLEGRLVVQWKLDRAPGAPPAQIIFSGQRGTRTAIAQASAIPSQYQASFATGAVAHSRSNGWDMEWQLPSRYATLIGKFYSGADLRYFFAGQLYSFFNDTQGLTNTVSVASVDGASTLVLGTDANGQQVVAPQRPVRAQGGFAQLSLPLSSLFNANPSGRMAGWSMSLLYGVDQAKTRDLNRLGSAGNRRYSTVAVGTLNYSLNRWVTFSFEQSLYTTHANPQMALPLYRGIPSREWNDVREEFGPIFTF
jgi:hypothetical protein